MLAQEFVVILSFGIMSQKTTNKKLLNNKAIDLPKYLITFC